MDLMAEEQKERIFSESEIRRLIDNSQELCSHQTKGTLLLISS
jgi:hypothetical protein